MNQSIHEIIRDAENNYIFGTTKLGNYVDFQMHDTIEKIAAYYYSKHTSGDKDSLGRDKPFFNIVVAATNIWYRATDIDRKDVNISATKSSGIVLSFLGTVLLQNWMRKARFGVYLNQWGRILAQYGSAVSKFVETDGELLCSVIPWNRIICDPVDFNALPMIEKIYKTPAQLRKIKEYDQTVVESLISATTTRKTLQGQTKDLKSDFIELFEVHGELPVALLKKEPKDEDWKEYRQQVHVVSYVQNKSGEYDDFTLYKGKEKKNPYMLHHLIEEDGRTLAIGAIEYLFDAQWMQNHSIKNMKDTLDLASKLIFQTADPVFAGRNVLSAIETGDILIHKENLPLTQINNSKADIVAFQNFSNQWKVLAQEITSTPDALRGNTLPSGTPYSLGAYLGQQANSLFEVMTENKGLAIEDMLREFIIPHLKTKMDTKDEVAAILQDHDIQKIDAIYIPKEAIRRYNSQAKEMVLNGQMPPVFNQAEIENQVRSELSPLGNQRFFTPEDITWNEALKNLEWEAEVNITNENKDKQAALTTLSTILQSIASNPAILQDPNAKLIFNKILNTVGNVSPIELSMAGNKPTPAVVGDGAIIK
ncbi:MAG: hypothetical protein L6Q29_03600 [Candidatus Pacebacteria bacterium]|nr:hypothetical protein [Candidatus Paceibacterota bacterium]NUQ57492.1 hypothetical protein [Candidatus Paceibacter sp.]